MRRNHPFFWPVVVFLFLLGLIAAAGYFFLVTTAGADAILRFGADQKGLRPQIHFRATSGRLLGTYVIRGLAFSDPPGLPRGSVFHADRIELTPLVARKPVFKIRAGNIRLEAPWFSKPVVIKRVEGSLLGEITVRDIQAVISEPAQAVVKIQALSARFPFHAQNVMAVENGRLLLSSSDPVLFFGKQEHGQLDFQLYSKKINLRDLLDPIHGNRKLQNIHGGLEGVDLRLVGDPQKPSVMGNFEAPEISYRRFRILGAAAYVDLKPRKEKKEWKLDGTIALERGILQFGETSIRFEPGRFVFNGDPAVPHFELEGFANVQDVPIHIVARGTPQKPEFRLSSTPQLPEEQILVMLATGSGWAGTEQAIRQGKVSADVAKEFIDYFLLGGSGARLAHSLGIKEVSLLYDEEKRGVEVKKGLSSRLDAVYGIETAAPQSTQSAPGGATQKIGAEYKLNKISSIAVETKKELASRKIDALSADTLDRPAPRQSVTVEYKRKF